MSNFKLVKEDSYTWPFAWYDPDTDTICLTRTKDWFCPTDIIHESEHAAINKVAGKEACIAYDNVAYIEA